MTVLIGMFLLGLFIALGTWVLSWSDHVKKQLVVKVYFQQNASQAQMNAVARRLRTNPDVKKYTFVSKTAALQQMEKRYPQPDAEPRLQSAARLVRDRPQAAARWSMRSPRR